MAPTSRSSPAHRAFLVPSASVVLALVVATAAAQDAPVPDRRPIELRLIDVLRQNGVITEEQKATLLASAEEMRREDERLAKDEGDLADRIDGAKKRVQVDGVRLRHEPGDGFTFSTGDRAFELTISGRLQLRFTHAMWDEHPPSDDDNETGFGVEQARLEFSGRAFEKWLRYKILFDAVGGPADTEVNFLNIIDDFSSDNALTELKEAWVELARFDAFRVRIGQFKTPYSRHYLNSAAALQFVDRAPTNRVFVPGRDVGVMVHGEAFGEDDDVLGYAVGLFNGEGINRPNDDHGLLGVARVSVSPFGALGNEEGHLSKSGRFRLALGVNAFAHQDDRFTGEGTDHSFGLDLAATWAGFSLLAEYHQLDLDVATPEDPHAEGWFVQFGYTLIERELEVAVRTAHVDWDDNASRNSALREHLIVVNWFFAEHAWKLQTDFGWVEDHEGNQADDEEGYRLRMQLQVAF